MATPYETVLTKWTDLAEELNGRESDVYVCPNILGYYDRKAKPSSFGNEPSSDSIVVTSGGMVTRLHQWFGRRRKSPSIGKKLVAVLTWMYDRGSLGGNANLCHVFLLLIDFRADNAPYDVYLYEPMEVCRDNPERVAPPRLIIKMYQMSEKQGMPVITTGSRGLYVYGDQKAHEKTCFPKVMRLTRKLWLKGAENGLNWLKQSFRTQTITRYC